MSDPKLIFREDWARIDRLLVGGCTEDDVRALEQSLHGNLAAQKVLLDYLQLHIDLSIDVRAETASQPLLAQMQSDAMQQVDPLQPVDPLQAPPSTAAPLGFIQETFQRGSDWLSRPTLLFSIAVVALAVAFGAWRWIDDRWTDGRSGNDVAARDLKPETPVSLSGESPATPSAYVARIVKASTDCVWGELAAPAEFLLRVRAGDRMHVVAGLVEMEFHSGARVILHGPAVFTPTGPASGHLESGRLTGEAANGNFRLMTPAAEVVDLGTAFGVVADAEAGTDVVVFDGKVQVLSRSDGAAGGEAIDMTEGMAARFRFDGTTEYGLKTDASQFARRILPRGENPDELCLIDMIAGGNGQGASLAGAIDPLSGMRDYGEAGRRSKHFARWSDGAFHPAAWHALIDGLFIPWSEGRSVQIDSVGRKIDTPHCTGTTHGSIWARRKESVLKAADDRDNDFWGTRTLKGIVERLTTVRTGLVGMHANVGMTIDLRTLRMVHRRAPTAFRTAVANIENSADWAPHERPVPEVETLIADCRVFVDGGLRYSRLGFCREDGELQMDVPLSPSDRFLTILVTDGDGEMRFDHVVLIDPVIVLERE